VAPNHIRLEPVNCIERWVLGDGRACRVWGLGCGIVSVLSCACGGVHAHACLPYMLHITHLLHRITHTHVVSLHHTSSALHCTHPLSIHCITHPLHWITPPLCPTTASHILCTASHLPCAPPLHHTSSVLHYTSPVSHCHIKSAQHCLLTRHLVCRRQPFVDCRSTGLVSDAGISYPHTSTQTRLPIASQPLLYKHASRLPLPSQTIMFGKAGVNGVHVPLSPLPAPPALNPPLLPPAPPGP